MKHFTSAILLAAGKATRMTAVTNKQTALIGGKSVIERTLSAFDKAETVSEIILVANEEIAAFVRTLTIEKIACITEGGSCREESARNGILAADPQSEFVAIHDGARPLIQPEEIDRAVRLAYQTGAVCCGTKPKSTVKQTDKNGFIAFTPKRDALFEAATPQIFRKEQILSAMEAEKNRLADFTDDCSIAEKHGIPIKTCLCSYENIKITTDDDLLLAELLLKNR